MRLLYITNGITGAGGLERVLSTKASYLADTLGYDVHIVSLDEAGKPFYHFSPEITFHTVKTGFKLRPYILGLRKLVRELCPDVISVCDDGLKGFFVPLWIGGKARIIYERHVSKEMITQGQTPTLKQHISLGLMDIGSRLYNRFVVLTNENKKQWNGKNVVVIPNPLSFYPDIVSKLNTPRIIAVGKVSCQKGYDRLLAAWLLIKDKYPEWHIDIFGTSTPNDPLHEQVKGTRIHINAPVKDIQHEYLTSSIYVLPSRFEGFGMVLIEAMACGVPCVAFDCPCGPSDIIRDGEDGLLVENGNIEGFAQKLSLLIENENLRKEMGEKARINVQRYNINTIAQQWDKLFRNL